MASLGHTNTVVEVASNNAVNQDNKHETLLRDDVVEVIRRDVVNKINLYRKPHKLPSLRVKDEVNKYSLKYLFIHIYKL